MFECARLCERTRVGGHTESVSLQSGHTWSFACELEIAFQLGALFPTYSRDHSCRLAPFARSLHPIAGAQISTQSRLMQFTGIGNRVASQVESERQRHALGIKSLEA